MCRYDEALSQSLVQHVCKSVSGDLLVRFVGCFLLESNLTSVRWQAHSLVLHIYRFVTVTQLLMTVWSKRGNIKHSCSSYYSTVQYSCCTMF